MPLPAGDPTLGLCARPEPFGCESAAADNVGQGWQGHEGAGGAGR